MNAVKYSLVTLACILVCVAVVLAGYFFVFVNAKLEKPLNNIHRDAVVCSLEYSQTTQNTLITQVSQYQQLELRRANGENTGAAELALVQSMKEEVGILSTCGGDIVPSGVQAFLANH